MSTVCPLLVLAPALIGQRDEEIYMKERSGSGGDKAPTKRRYLSSAERKREILAAAFIEFSQRGFLATSLECIAVRAGISKSGIYSHYRSKSEVFEDMLVSALLPSFGWKNAFPEAAVAPIKTDALCAVVNCYVDELYAKLSEPGSLAAFRLLLTESARVPELTRGWVDRLLAHMMLGDSSVLDYCVQQGIGRPGVSREQFALAGAPSAFWVMQLLLLGGKSSVASIEAVKALHSRLLLEVLA